MKNRTLSMNRTLRVIILMGYAAFVLLLLLNTANSLANTRQTQINAQREALNGCMSELRSAMDTLEKLVYDIWSTDRNFLELSGNPSPTQAYEGAYYLRESLRNRMLLEDALHGYIIFYQGNDSVWYRSKDISLVSTEQMRDAVSELKENMQSYGGSRSWLTLEAEGDLLLAVISRRNNAAIAMLYNPRGLRESARRLLGKECDVDLATGDGVLLTEGSGAPFPEIAGEAAAGGAQFEGRAGDRRIYGQRVPKLELWLVLSAADDFAGIMNAQIVVLALLSAVSIFVVVYLLRFYKNSFAVPMRKLTRVMEQVRTGEITEVPMLNLHYAELQDVNRTLAAMVSEIENQKVQIYEEVIEKQKAQMQYLQLQLRPHFYLNGLKTINAMAINGDTKGIQTVAGDISEHLRYLFQENQVVKLSDELRFVRNYISMQENAFGRSIAVRYDVQEGARDCLVPILCVQTFVENSVKYARTAIAGMPLELTVRIDRLATEDGRFVDVIVSDNGQGYSEAILERINSGNYGDDGQAVGIGNIIRRCRLIYGEMVELNFYNDGGAVSELIMPEVLEGKTV